MVKGSSSVLLLLAVLGGHTYALNLYAKLSSNEICALLQPGEIILYPNTCNKWVRCATSGDVQDEEEAVCPEGLHFDKETKRCQFADEVVCPFAAAQGSRCANREDGVFLADPQRCNGYIYCKSGRETNASCPNDLVFDPKRAACVYPREYTCPDHVQEVSSNLICQSVRENILLANPENCIKYFRCENGHLSELICDTDFAYDHVLGRCVDKNTVHCHPTAKQPEPENFICGTDEAPLTGYIADEDSCSGYYYCAKQASGRDRHPKFLKCDTGFFFDATMWSCRDRLNVKCNRDRCEGMDNKYVNIAGDCSAYARCGNNMTVSKGSCPTNYYFDERTQGCTPHNINYVACAA